MYIEHKKLPTSCELVIIGAGATGLMTAYELTKKGFNDIVIIDQSYLTSGSSGRNGGGIREQWNSPQSITIMKECINRFEKLHTELGFNFFFRQDGYLFLAFSDEQCEQLEKNVTLQNELGVQSRIMSANEIKKLYPLLNLSDVKGGSFNQRDGTMVPFCFCWGLIRQLTSAGITLSPFTKALNIETTNGRVTGIETSKGSIKCNQILNATNAWADSINKMVGLDCQVQPERHQILASEPLKSFLDPMIVSLENGIYFSQTSRGEIVGGVGLTDEPLEFNTDASLHFVKKMARSLVHLLPGMKNVRLMRQWAGLYAITPDHSPIFDKNSKVDGFFQAVGYSGHGFMMAPVAGEIMADLIHSGETHWDISPFAVNRFKNKNFRKESAVLG